MATATLHDLLAALPSDPSWGPPESNEKTLNGVPYAPFSKGDKLGRMADWTSEGKDRERGGRQNYNRNYRDQQVYGAGTSSLFSVQAAEDEATFSVVDNTRTTSRGRGFGRGGNAIFRGRGARGAAAAGQRGARGGPGTFQRIGGRGGQQQQQYANDRGGRGGRGGRRFGWKDYDKPQRNRDASITVRADWAMLEEIDFVRLSKLNLDVADATDLDSYGFLHYYDRNLDKQPGSKTAERKLQVLERAAYNITTSSDPIIQELAEKDEATVFATDNILSMLMCAPRSVYSWDIVLERRGKHLFIDKREGSSLDMVSVNENAADAPLELSEGNKDSINAPGSLMLEATHINNVFPLTCVSESSKKDMPNEHPFYSAETETDPPASKAYKYRKFDLATESSADPLHMVVRTELDAVVRNALTGDDNQLTIHALNEFDNKAQGAGGALDWRTKLASQRGAVVATEMKNNSCKLARWTTQAVLAGADLMKLGFVARATPRDTNHHVVLGVLGYKPREFASQMNLNLGNGWAIVRTIVDMITRHCEEHGDDKERQKFILTKDPNKSLLRLYEIPPKTFEEDDADEEPDAAPAQADGAEEEQ